MEFENAISRPEKVINFREMADGGHGKAMKFHFDRNISCCLKTGKILLVIEQNFNPKS